MKKIFVSCLCLSIVLFSCSSALAADTAKSLGMGGAMVAVPDDSSAAYFNPALLVNTKTTCVGLSLTSSSIQRNWKAEISAGTHTLWGSDTNLWENTGIVSPLGPGTIYVGSGTLRDFVLGFKYQTTIKGDANTKLYAPSLAYGIQVLPNLALGAGLIYLDDYEKLSAKGGGNTYQQEISSVGLGASMGMLFSVNPMVDLGMSVFLPATLSISGNVKDSALSPSNFDVVGKTPDQSKCLLGAAIKPSENLTVGLQFDVMAGFKFNRSLTYDSSLGDRDLSIKGDSIVASRLGLEYRIDAGKGYFPIWAGVAFVPDNHLEAALPISDLLVEGLNLGVLKYARASSTSVSLGAGFKNELFEVGIAGQSTSGVARTIVVYTNEKITINDTRALISGSYKF